MPPPENLMIIIVGIIEKPTPGAATSVTGVVCSAKICALERLTETFGRSCATSERNVGGPADPDLGHAGRHHFARQSKRQSRLGWAELGICGPAQTRLAF